MNYKALAICNHHQVPTLAPHTTRSTPDGLHRSDSDPPHDLKAIRKELLPFMRTSDLQGAWQVIQDYLVAGAAIWAIHLAWMIDAMPWVVKLPVIFVGQLVIAGCIRGFVNLTHEASHYTLFKTRSLNRSLQFTFAFWAFRDVLTYGKWHRPHHAYLNTEKDPEWDYRRRWLIDEHLRGNAAKVFLWRPLMLYYTWDLVKHVMWPFWKTSEARVAKGIFWATVLAVVTLIGGWPMVALCFLIPLLVFYPLIGAFVEASEHTGLFGKAADLDGGRNRFWHPILEFILLRHNDGPHGLHHWVSGIPGHNLKAAYRFLREKYGLAFVESLSVNDTVTQMLGHEGEDEISVQKLDNSRRIESELMEAVLPSNPRKAEAAGTTSAGPG